MISSTKKGNQLEERVASILRLFEIPTNVKVKHSVMDTTAESERKIDVVVIDEFGIAFGIECKNHKYPIKVGDIEKWKTQCDDMGIPHRIFVSSSGYQVGAINKANHHKIILLEWKNNKVFFPSWWLPSTVLVKEQKIQILKADIIADDKVTLDSVKCSKKVFFIDQHKWSLDEIARKCIDKESRTLEDKNQYYFDRVVKAKFAEGGTICLEGPKFGLKVKGIRLYLRIHEINDTAPLHVEKLQFHKLGFDIAFAFILDRKFFIDGQNRVLAILVSQITNQGTRPMRAEWLSS